MKAYQTLSTEVKQLEEEIKTAAPEVELDSGASKDNSGTKVRTEFGGQAVEILSLARHEACMEEIASSTYYNDFARGKIADYENSAGITNYLGCFGVTTDRIRKPSRPAIELWINEPVGCAIDAKIWLGT